MKKIYNHIYKCLDALAKGVIVIGFLVMFVLVFANVTGRYLFSTGFATADEGARYVLIFTLLFGLIEVTKKREHFFVDIVVKAVPAVVGKIFTVIVDLFTIVIVGFMLRGGYQLILLNQNSRSPAIHFPLWIPYAVLLFACAVMELYLIVQFLEDVGLQITESEEGGETNAS